MARSIWSGSLSFGLVNVPVRLYSATKPQDIHFHQFEEGTGRRVRNLRVAEGTTEEVPYEDIVKGYEVDNDRWVMLSPEELESAEPHRSRTLEIEDFVSLDEIDPIYFEHTYYLGPEPDAGAERAYRLLLEALRKSGRVAIGRFVMRGKEYLAAIRPLGDVLALETLYFGDEVRDPRKEIENLPTDVKPSSRELDIAGQLVDSLTTSWKPDNYRDTYRDKVRELIDRKAAGETVEIERDRSEPAPVIDLLAALEASVARRAGQRGDTKSGSGESPSDSNTSASRRGSSAKEPSRKGSSGQASSGQASPRKDPPRKPSSSRGRRSAAPSSRGQTELTRDELVEQARKAGIRGRSKMSKEQLAEALSQAS